MKKFNKGYFCIILCFLFTGCNGQDLLISLETNKKSYNFGEDILVKCTVSNCCLDSLVLSIFENEILGIVFKLESLNGSNLNSVFMRKSELRSQIIVDAKKIILSEQEEYSISFKLNDYFLQRKIGLPEIELKKGSYKLIVLYNNKIFNDIEFSIK